MTIIALGITFIGAALAVAVGIKADLDALTLVILALVLAAGALVVAVVRRSSSTSVGPTRCADCGGIVSPNAPFCKHCRGPLFPAEL